MLDTRAEQLAAEGLPIWRRRMTLFFCVLLHAFTHAYAVLLVPLYFIIQKDFGLSRLGYVSALVTIYWLVYCAGSYFAGMAADRFNRARVLAVGLGLNGAMFVAMSAATSYSTLVVFVILGGLCGSLFHPAGNGLAISLFPRHGGTAVGIMGMGTAIGFFSGFRYSGWRSGMPGWGLNVMPGAETGWRAPCFEIGALGVIVSALVWLLARDVPRAHPDRPQSDSAQGAPGDDGITFASLLLPLMAVSIAFCLRDFGGNGVQSTLSAYLQKAWGMAPDGAGRTLALMSIVGAVANPILGHFSHGRRRLPTLTAALVLAAIGIMSIPFWKPGLILIPLAFYNFFALGTYAVGETALMERVPPRYRGRMIGLLLLVAGGLSSSAHLVAGAYCDRLGNSASDPAAYRGWFIFLGFLVLCSVAAVPFIGRLGTTADTVKRDGNI
ncbi:MAG TPA: MFS transporter [Candidatus Brocadiia bacterium]|nr:MFS transporter [Candidatus Brocadiia bacterium]